MQILTCLDSGELTTGAKRQKLLQQASGDYVVFIDDDDEVSAGYIPGLLTALYGNPDCVSIHGWRRLAGGGCMAMPMVMSREKKFQVLHRPINHLCPVRRELALKVGFANMDCGEDCDFADRLSPLLTSESQADLLRVQYLYNFDSDKSATWRPAVYANRFGSSFDITLHLSAELPWSYVLRAIMPDGQESVLMAGSQHGGQPRQMRVRREGPQSPLLYRWSATDPEQVGPATGRFTLTSPQRKKITLKTTDCTVDGRPAVIRYTRLGL